MFQLQDTNTVLLVPGAEGKLNIKLNETAVTDYRAGWLPLHQGKVNFPPGKVSERQAVTSWFKCKLWLEPSKLHRSQMAF